MRLRTRPAEELFLCACVEAERLSFAVGIEHLVLACAVAGALDVDPDAIREWIVLDERDALASLGISRESVRDELEERLDRGGCGLPVSPAAKRMLELATRRRRHVTPEQLLATLREHSPTARRMLFELERA